MRFLIYILLLISYLNTGTFAQGDQNTWDFPVKPGTEKWKALKNNIQKVRVCQVPEEILKNIETSTLIQICLDYPLLPDIMAFNDIKAGFKKFEGDFNGFRELIKRDDADIELLTKYKNIDPELIPSKGTIIEKGNYVLSLSFIELFISHPFVLEKFGRNEKKEIIKEILFKKEKKKQRPVWYNGIGLQTCYLAMVKLIESDSTTYKSELNSSGILLFINSGILLRPEIIEQIEQAANEYLNHK